MQLWARDGRVVPDDAYYCGYTERIVGALELQTEGTQSREILIPYTSNFVRPQSKKCQNLHRKGVSTENSR